MKSWLIALMLLTPATVHASALSWDGPGLALTDLLGVPLTVSHPAFDPGTYVIAFDGGLSAFTDTEVSVVSAVTSATLLKLTHGTFHPFSVTQTFDEAWVLRADTDSVKDALSTGPQWAFAVSADGRLHFGLEDLDVRGYTDNDHNDVYGTITRVNHHDPPPTTVPEPSPWVMIGSGLGFMVMARKLRGGK